MPAWRATRVAPVEALRDAAGTSAPAAAAGARRCGPLVGALGRPVQATGGPAAMLARRNAMRDPGRTAVTASALTIGVALVTAVTVVAAGLQDSTKGSLEKRVSADARAHAARTAGRRSTATPRARRAAVPGVRTASTIRQDAALAFGQTESVNAVDPATIGKVARLQVEGRLAGHAGRAGRRRRDRRRGLGQGAPPRRRRTRSRSPRRPTGRLTLTVRGIEDSPVIDALGLGPITIGTPAYAAGASAGARTT